MNYASLHFHYASDYVGRMVQAVQRLHGMRRWHFCHVSATLANGVTLEQYLGRTIIGYKATPDLHVGVSLMLPTPLDDITLGRNALRHYQKWGEMTWRVDTSCVELLTSTFDLPRHLHYPAELFDYAIRRTLSNAPQ